MNVKSKSNNFLNTRIMNEDGFVRTFCLLNCALGTYQKQLMIPMGGNHVRRVLFGKDAHLVNEGARYLGQREGVLNPTFIEKGYEIAVQEIKERFVTKISRREGEKYDSLQAAREIYQEIFKENRLRATLFLLKYFKDFEQYKPREKNCMERTLEWLFPSKL